jgi:drug/metabolite transporter (DMT)-like permease
MTDTGWLWAVFTVIAALAQTVRNATQRELTGKIGTAGATFVRFLFGCPFALVFLAGVRATGDGFPDPPFSFWPWMLDGAMAQIAATALMLAAMEERSFVVTIAYLKTEPVQVAVFGLVFLGDAVTPLMGLAIAIATAGVIIISLKPGRNRDRNRGDVAGLSGLRPTLLGLSSAGCFALSAIGYRGAILSLRDPSFVMAATYTMTVGLVVQSGLLLIYLVLRNRTVLRQIAVAWRPSLFAGFMGALGSQFWFLAFALTSAANVRTLALIEVVFAQAVSRFAFHQKVSRREALGIAVIVTGVALLIAAY